jgi:anti-sigma B factor antagonist
MSDASEFPIGPVMTGRLQEAGDVLVVSLIGEFDLAAQDDFPSLLDELGARGPRAIVVDLGEVTFLDSTGARLLYEAEGRASGCRFAVLNGSGPAHRALTLTGLDRHIAIIEHIDELVGGG